MAPLTFTLISLKSAADGDRFIHALKLLSPTEWPVWAATCHQWMHEPHISVEALSGTGDRTKRWDYVVVFMLDKPSASPALPATIQPFVEESWSLTADVPNEQIESLKARREAMLAGAVPPLPEGFSAENHTVIDAAKAEKDVELSLETPTRPFGTDTSQSGPALKTVIRDLGIAHPGPVVMFNLLSYLPGQRDRYMGYIAAFIEKIGPKFGGQPVLGLANVTGWSSQAAEKGQVGGWEDTALVWYPSVWHFGAMLHDPIYVDLDRKHKGGVLRDNPLICCQEINLDK